MMDQQKKLIFSDKRDRHAIDNIITALPGGHVGNPGTV
jgi:hypothetical protein